MSEVVLKALDRNLQLVLDRYSIVGEAADPSRIDITNANGRYMNSIGARKAHLYGELTSHGLTLVWAGAHTADSSSADVLIIDHSYVTAGSHIYHRRQARHDWYDHTGLDAYTSIPLASHADTLTTMPYELAAEDLPDDDFGRMHSHYMRTAQALAKFATASNVNDALHQTVAKRYRPVSERLEPLHPYAGQAYGPRVNLQEMLDAGVNFHPAVAEALRLAPEMTIDN